MKKTIISTLAVMLALPAYATGIAPSDTGDNMCIYNVLNTYTGPANLQAGWQANTIQLKWYNGDQQLNVQSAANNCTYDSGLTIPSTAPTKTGYTFAGWKIKAAAGGLCGLTSSGVTNAEILLDATHARWKPLNGSSGYTMASEFETENSSGLNNGEWEVIDSNGNKYRGIASCNSTQSSYDWGNSVYAAEDAIWENESLTEEEKEAQSYALYVAAYANSANQSPAGTINSNSTGQYCWCHAESYTPNGGSACNVSSLAWVFFYDYGSAGDCADNCAYDCARNVQHFSPFRAAVFGVAGN